MHVEKNVESIIELVKIESTRLQGLSQEVGKVVVGNQDIIDFIIIAVLCNGHILLEGVPGVAKTTIIKSIARALGLEFNRVQFTPDLLPSDVIGTLIYNQKTQEFETKKGPIFANLVLADEINRSPAKVQSALLEAMQEHQVTIGSNTYKLDEPFLVFATQNPIEQEGTYKLPEAQLDRFMFKLNIEYPNKTQEREILHRTLDLNEIIKVLNKQDVFENRNLVKQVYTDEKIIEYIVNITFATRQPEEYGLSSMREFIQYGVSPRATLALHHAAKAHAFMKKRHFVTPDDVKAVALPILRHRIILTYEAEAQQITTDHFISKILHTIAAP